jgi:hypothetical protein
MDTSNITDEKVTVLSRNSIFYGLLYFGFILSLLLSAAPLKAETTNDIEEEPFVLPTESVTIGDLVKYAY